VASVTKDRVRMPVEYLEKLWRVGEAMELLGLMFPMGIQLMVSVLKLMVWAVA